MTQGKSRISESLYVSSIDAVAEAIDLELPNASLQ